MAKNKELKTNAMRILERLKIPFQTMTYECDEFIDALRIADQLGLPYEKVYKTLVTRGHSGGYFVFVVPVESELDLKKCAKSVGEKSVEMIHVKDITRVTGYVRGGSSPLGMKKPYVTTFHISAEQLPTMMVSAGKIGYQIELAPGDLVRLAQGQFADIVRKG